MRQCWDCDTSSSRNGLTRDKHVARVKDEGATSEISTSTPGKSNSGSQCWGTTCLQDATSKSHIIVFIWKYFPRTYHPNHSISPNVGKYALSVMLVFSRSLSGVHFFTSTIILFWGFSTEVFCIYFCDCDILWLLMRMKNSHKIYVFRLPYRCWGKMDNKYTDNQRQSDAKLSSAAVAVIVTYPVMAFDWLDFQTGRSLFLLHKINKIYMLDTFWKCFFL